MVLDMTHSAQTQQPNLEENVCDVCSYDSSSEDSDDCSKDIALQNEPPVPSFGNVAVSNSSNVHFGNKTYYQGPVSIKQILYANPKEHNGVVLKISDGIGKENSAFVPDHLNNGIDSKDGHKLENQTQKEVKIESKWLKVLTDKRFFVTTVVILTILVVIATLLTVLIIAANSPKLDGITDSEEEESLYSTTSDDTSIQLTLSGKLRLVPRTEWIARPPKGNLSELKLPVSLVVISHTATKNCSSISLCKQRAKTIQNFHMDSQNWSDIGYSFMVGGDGLAYEGRGWRKQGAHTFGFNSKSIGISFIGTFNDLEPPKIQVVAALQLIEIGVEKGYLTSDYQVMAHRQFSRTSSPGDKLYSLMKTWPHWSEKYEKKMV